MLHYTLREKFSNSIEILLFRLNLKINWTNISLQDLTLIA